MARMVYLLMGQDMGMLVYLLKTQMLERTFMRFYNSSGSSVGTITQNGTSSTSYNTSSDYRLKENIIPMTGSIDRLKQLKPSRFNFIDRTKKTEEQSNC